MAKESRFAEIYRQQLMKDKGIFGAFASTASERAKERADLRRLLPKSGITGAISQRIFGKPYRSGTSSSVSEKADSARITRVDMNSQVTARNTSVLPAMAREMNLTRLNMQKLVKLAGGTPSKTSTFKDKSLKESSTSTIGKTVGGIGSAAGGMLSGLFNALGGLGAGIISIGGSILSGIVGLLGSVGGTIFKVIGAGLSLLGPMGIILTAGAGFLIYQISKSIDFDKLKEDFGKLYKNVKEGIMNFFGLSDEEDSPSIARQFADKLDDFFGTTNFNDTLDFIEDTFSDMKISIISNSTAAWNTLKNLFSAVGSDMMATTKQFYSNYRTALIAIGGAQFGSMFGPIGAVVGLGAGLAYATGTKTYDNMTEEELLNEKENLKRQMSQEELSKRTKGMLPHVAKTVKENWEKQNEERQKKISVIEQELEKRKLGATSNFFENLVPTYTSNVANESSKLREEEEKRRSERARNRMSKRGEDSSTMARRLEREYTEKSATPSKVTIDENSKKSIENYLGRSISDEELDLLYRATYAESAHTAESYGNVMGVILNRARNSGRSILEILTEANQFQAVTGTKNNNNTPSNLFIKGPSGNNLAKLNEAALKILPNVSKKLDSFTATDPAAYGPGTTMKWLEHLKSVPGSFTKDGTIFAENQYKGFSGKLMNVKNIPKTIPSQPDKDKTDIFDNMLAMISGVVGLITETNKNIQGVAQTVAATTAGSEQNSNVIASPYDMELREMLLQFHSDIATPLGS